MTEGRLVATGSSPSHDCISKPPLYAYSPAIHIANRHAPDAVSTSKKRPPAHMTIKRNSEAATKSPSNDHNSPYAHRKSGVRYRVCWKDDGTINLPPCNARLRTQLPEAELDVVQQYALSHSPCEPRHRRGTSATIACSEALCIATAHNVQHLACRGKVVIVTGDCQPPRLPTLPTRASRFQKFSLFHFYPSTQPPDSCLPQ